MYNLKEFTSRFNQLARVQSHSEVFSAFLDFFLFIGISVRQGAGRN